LRQLYNVLLMVEYLQFAEIPIFDRERVLPKFFFSLNGAQEIHSLPWVGTCNTLEPCFY